MFCDNFATILILPTALKRPYCMVKNAVAAQARPGTDNNDWSPIKGGTTRATCWQWFQAINPAQPSTHLIELADLTLLVYECYLTPLKKQAQKRSRDGAQDKTMETCLSQSAFEGATSSLAHLYTECGLDKLVVSKYFWTILKVYKLGSRRTSAKENKLGISTVEGKKHLPFAGYLNLALELTKIPKLEHIYARVFLILEWNLVSRTEFVVDAKIDIVSFTKYVLLFDMGITTTD